MLPAVLIYSQRASALTVRRFHDLGKKGGWRIKSPGLNLLFMLAAMPVALVVFMVCYLLFIAALMTMSQSVGLIIGVLGLVVAALGVALWKFYQLACMPGMRGENEYGPDPLDRPPSGGAPAPSAPMVVRIAPQPVNAGFGRRRA
jgi:uncharacterized membrane protein YhaH (DUF805 family)